MSTEPKLSHDAEDLLADVTRYVEAAEEERQQLREDLANVRALLKMVDADRAEIERQLVAAEKRAEEAETLLKKAAEMVESADDGAPLQCLADAIRALKKSDATDDAEARRDGKMVMP